VFINSIWIEFFLGDHLRDSFWYSLQDWIRFWTGYHSLLIGVCHQWDFIYQDKGEPFSQKHPYFDRRFDWFFGMVISLSWILRKERRIS